jgi:hypothetical protein
MAKGRNWDKDRARRFLADQTHAASMQHAAEPPTSRSAWLAIRGGVMPWGKHKGRRLSAIPLDYLTWLYGVRRPGDPLRRAIGAELFTRRRQTRAADSLDWRRIRDMQSRSNPPKPG